ncbi:MAG: helix-turn-helix domain-containing protein [Litorivicinaceae bacterium]
MTPKLMTVGDPQARPYGWVSADERGSIENALKENFGNKTQAARVLGMSLRQLRYRMQKLGIS